jgi:hypothetical protein
MKMRLQRSSLRASPWLALTAIWIKARSSRRQRKQRLIQAKHTQSTKHTQNVTMTYPGFRTLAAVVVFSAFAATRPGVANAQAGPAQQACKADYQRLCANVSPGGGRIIACLQGQAEKLSAPCKDALAKSGK